MFLWPSGISAGSKSTGCIRLLLCQIDNPNMIPICPNLIQFVTYSETITICPNMVIIPNFRYVLGELKWADSDLPFFGVDESAITGLLLIFVFLGGAIQIYTISLDPSARP